MSKMSELAADGERVRRFTDHPTAEASGTTQEADRAMLDRALDRVDERMRDAAEQALNRPLLAMAADRLHATYGTPKVVACFQDRTSDVVYAMFEDGRWAQYSPRYFAFGEWVEGRWRAMPRCVYADVKGIGPTPEEAEGARDD